MNGLINIALVCFGIALLGAVCLICEKLNCFKPIRKAINKFLETLPLMNGD